MELFITIVKHNHWAVVVVNFMHKQFKLFESRSQDPNYVSNLVAILYVVPINFYFFSPCFPNQCCSTNQSCNRDRELENPGQRKKPMEAWSRHIWVLKSIRLPTSVNNVVFFANLHFGNLIWFLWSHFCTFFLADLIVASLLFYTWRIWLPRGWSHLIQYDFGLIFFFFCNLWNVYSTETLCNTSSKDTSLQH